MTTILLSQFQSLYHKATYEQRPQIWGSKSGQYTQVWVYIRGGRLFSSAGHIALLLVSRGPHFSQKGKVKAKKNWPSWAGCGPRAVCCPLLVYINTNQSIHWLLALQNNIEKRPFRMRLLVFRNNSSYLSFKIDFFHCKLYFRQLLSLCKEKVTN